jgi:hypothetical protein
MLCKIWGFHGSHYEECRILGYKNPVRISQETYYVSATQPSRLMLCKIWRFHGGDYEECRLLGYKTPGTVLSMCCHIPWSRENSRTISKNVVAHVHCRTYVEQTISCVAYSRFWRWKHNVPPKHQRTSVVLRCVTSQKILLFVFTGWEPQIKERPPRVHSTKPQSIAFTKRKWAFYGHENKQIIKSWLKGSWTRVVL